MDIIRKNKEKRINPLKIIIIILGIFVFGLASSIFYFYKKYNEAKKNPEVAIRDEKSDIVGKVGKLMELPEEDPLVATITDKEKLKEQYFFSKAQNGDVVMIYSNSKKAILYRPSINKIIEVSSLIDESRDSSKGTEDKEEGN